ncbi:MAG TPA: VCBS repeat-containing protein, partial [Thermoanaerobaculia bacterium]|nr:VCBS repeat-containing protein [Thermoanaerobaculia bacterium]
MRRLLLAILLLATTAVTADECRYGFTTGDKFGSGLVSSAVFADFNEDGLVDFIVSDGFFNNLYLNRGYGEYDKKQLAFNGDVLAAADVNGDGHMDVVLDPAIGAVSGDGKGNFGALIRSGNPTSPKAERLVDLNGDGLKDIVYKTYVSPAALIVQFATGDGHFGPPTEIVAPIRADSNYRIGDF